MNRITATKRHLIRLGVFLVAFVFVASSSALAQFEVGNTTYEADEFQEALEEADSENEDLLVLEDVVLDGDATYVLKDNTTIRSDVDDEPRTITFDQNLDLNGYDLTLGDDPHRVDLVFPDDLVLVMPGQEIVTDFERGEVRFTGNNTLSAGGQDGAVLTLGNVNVESGSELELWTSSDPAESADYVFNNSLTVSGTIEGNQNRIYYADDENGDPIAVTFEEEIPNEFFSLTGTIDGSGRFTYAVDGTAEEGPFFATEGSGVINLRTRIMNSEESEITFSHLGTSDTQTNRVIDSDNLEFASDLTLQGHFVVEGNSDVTFGAYEDEDEDYDFGLFTEVVITGDLSVEDGSATTFYADLDVMAVSFDNSEALFAGNTNIDGDLLVEDSDVEFGESEYDEELAINVAVNISGAVTHTSGDLDFNEPGEDDDGDDRPNSVTSVGGDFTFDSEDIEQHDRHELFLGGDLLVNVDLDDGQLWNIELDGDDTQEIVLDDSNLDLEYLVVSNDDTVRLLRTNTEGELFVEQWMELNQAGGNFFVTEDDILHLDPDETTFVREDGHRLRTYPFAEGAQPLQIEYLGDQTFTTGIELDRGATHVVIEMAEGVDLVFGATTTIDKSFQLLSGNLNLNQFDLNLGPLDQDGDPVNDVDFVLGNGDVVDDQGAINYQGTTNTLTYVNTIDVNTNVEWPEDLRLDNVYVRPLNEGDEVGTITVGGDREVLNLNLWTGTLDIEDYTLDVRGDMEVNNYSIQTATIGTTDLASDSRFDGYLAFGDDARLEFNGITGLGATSNHFQADLDEDEERTYVNLPNVYVNNYFADEDEAEDDEWESFDFDYGHHNWDDATATLNMLSFEIEDTETVYVREDVQLLAIEGDYQHHTNEHAVELFEQNGLLMTHELTMEVGGDFYANYGDSKYQDENSVLDIEGDLTYNNGWFDATDYNFHLLVGGDASLDLGFDEFDEEVREFEIGDGNTFDLDYLDDMFYVNVAGNFTKASGDFTVGENGYILVEGALTDETGDFTVGSPVQVDVEEDLSKVAGNFYGDDVILNVYGDYTQADGDTIATAQFDDAFITVGGTFTVYEDYSDELDERNQFILGGSDLALMGDYNFQGSGDVIDYENYDDMDRGLRGKLWFVKEEGDKQVVESRVNPDAYFPSIELDGVGVEVANDANMNTEGILTLRNGNMEIPEHELIVHNVSPTDDTGLVQRTNAVTGAVQQGSRDSYVVGPVTRRVQESTPGDVVLGGYIWPAGIEGSWRPVMMRMPSTLGNAAYVTVSVADDPGVELEPFSVIDDQQEEDGLELNNLGSTFYTVEFDRTPAFDPSVRVAAGGQAGITQIKDMRLVQLGDNGEWDLAGTYDVFFDPTDDWPEPPNAFIGGVPNLQQEGVEFEGEQTYHLGVASDLAINPLDEDFDAQFASMLSGLHVVHDSEMVDTEGAGSVSALLDGNELTVAGSFHNLSGDFTDAHIHEGSAGNDGGVVLDLTVNEDEDGFLAGDNTFELDNEQLQQLENGELYVNIHTTDYEGGEIRGQLLEAPNEAPTATEIESPASDVRVDIEGDETQNFTATWTAAEDPDEDRVVYIWQLATDSDFNDIVLSTHTQTSRAVDLDYADVDAALEAAGVEVGDDVRIHHRAISSDGSNYSDGTSSSVLVRRGEVTDSPEDPEVPEELALDQNYPNPFNPTTNISYQLPERTDVQLTVYNSLGQEVATLVDESVDAGQHEVSFDASNLSSGVYIYRLQADGEVITKQMTFVK